MERSGYFNPESMHESLSIYRSTRQVPAKFDIARAGRTVGVITLPGILFSAGQTIMGKIDLRDAQLNCFGFELSLELSETIPESLAVKTPEQTLLSTRRVLSSQVETTAFAKEAIIELPIPALASPSFQTTAAKI
ncbi:reduced growth phenotype protein 1, partial [Protomyces lactucae-debilis]